MCFRFISLKRSSQFTITFQKSVTFEHLRKKTECHQPHNSIHIFQNLLFLYYITTCCMVLLYAGLYIGRLGFLCFRGQQMEV